MNETERDPRIDAAWRAASREEPPPALDAALRAAARREVEAGPRPARDKHWWYPLAAAATVGVIAIGLLQLTPPEQVAPSIVADTGAVKKEAASAPAAATASAPVAALNKDVSAKPEASSTPSAEPAQRQLDASAKPARMKDLGAVTGAPAAAPEPVMPAPRRSEPFPAAPPPATAARRDAAVAAEAQNAAREAAPASSALTAPSPPATGTVAGGMAPAPAAMEEKRARSQMALAKEADSLEAKQKTARSVDDWIKLIRQLRDEGRFDEATKELVAFRAAYGGRADALLPSDLRQLRPPAAGAK
jgi:hypothetical protein